MHIVLLHILNEYKASIVRVCMRVCVGVWVYVCVHGVWLCVILFQQHVHPHAMAILESLKPTFELASGHDCEFKIPTTKCAPHTTLHTHTHSHRVIGFGCGAQNEQFRTKILLPKAAQISFHSRIYLKQTRKKRAPKKVSFLVLCAYMCVCVTVCVCYPR